MTRPIRLAVRFLVVVAIAGALLYLATPMPSADNPYASSLNVVPPAYAASCRTCDFSTGKWRCTNSKSGGACKVTSSGQGCRSTTGCA